MTPAPPPSSRSTPTESLDLLQFELGWQNHFPAATRAPGAPGPQRGAPKVCAVYRAIRPILTARLIPFIPTKWKAALRTFQSLMDGLCPAT